jgi:aryl-alcohol dehydrogenase-like predicted oxidoreductase
MAMEYVILGNTGVEVSRLGLGTMSFGGEADDATARALFGRAREAGINLMDCADVYNNGRAETILGQLIADCRDEIILASKAYFPTGRDVNARGSSRFHLVRAVEASLRRLGTDRIDIYYLHRFDDKTGLEDTLRTLDDLVRQGKILYPAASNFAAWQVAKALGIAERRGLVPLACIQPMYNLVKRQAEVEILPMAASEGLAVFPYSPLGGGLLTGKYTREVRPERGRLIDSALYQTRYADSDYYQTAERFTALCRDIGHTPASVAVAWVMSHPAVTAPLVGARNLEQLDQSLAALKVPMTTELRERVSALFPAPPPATDRNEEATQHNYGQR